MFLRASPETLRSSSWPKEIGEEPGTLDRYYELAESMLEPEQYPHALRLPQKHHILRTQAGAFGLDSVHSQVPQTVASSAHTNFAGVTLNASERCGHDLTGLNDGSKKSTLVTYLADARNSGAEM